MLPQTDESISKIKELWDWAKELDTLGETSDFAEKKDSLVQYLKKNGSISEFSVQQFCFPSRVTKRYADEILLFKEGEKNEINKGLFKFSDLISAIWDRLKSINGDNIDAIFIILKDVVLFHAFYLTSELSHGRLFYQLNMCVILDEMIVEPDEDLGARANLISILTEVSEKAKFCLDSLETETIWTLAMLNYKVHQYESAIIFFEKFTDIFNDDRLRILHAKIYIGYCYEKSKQFNCAIDLFTQTLKELKDEPDSDKKYSAIIRELHHGLGHFYNERSVFANDDNSLSTEDILNARDHMGQALKEKVDYYSCYGSLFHEYGDYRTAQEIFDQASENLEIKNNNELQNELNFYIAQTKASMAEGDEQTRLAETIFKQFENYCKKTFNFDGIVHARVFKIRTYLRGVDFTSIRNNIRPGKIEKIEEWYRQLTEYSLSSYASKSIKEEYEKTICVLNIFKSLYADPQFVWHTADLLYYFKNYLKLMPEKNLKLDTSSEDINNNDKTNLYQIALDNLRIWCVGGKSFDNKKLTDWMSDYKIETKLFPVTNKTPAHTCIKGNRKPDLVVLIPPTEKDEGFEAEYDSIKESISELYFVYYSDPNGTYNEKWFDKKNSGNGKKNTIYTAKSAKDALLCAYSLRCFEILRKELLQPIPLFSLAPTHFSSSYDFQLGEKVAINFEMINDGHDDSPNLKKTLKFIDDKYSNNWLKKTLQKMNERSGNKTCVKGAIAVYCPNPKPALGIDNYIGYSAHGCVDATELYLPSFVEPEKFYTIKALPSYQNEFWDLANTLRKVGTPCERGNKNECITYEGEALFSSEDSKIATLCRSILRVLFGNEEMTNSVLDKPFSCIVRSTVLDTGTQEDSSIDIVLVKSDEPSTEMGDCPEEEKKNMKENPTVFVTYAWESSADDAIAEEYLKEITGFVNILRENGYDATFDRDMYTRNHNWAAIMTEGLQMDKIIVLLSPEYKSKADDWKEHHGVIDERNAIMVRREEDPENIILAKLPSQAAYSTKEVLPIMFAKDNVINLASESDTDGFNLLWRTLACKPIGDDLVEVNKNKNEGHPVK